MPTEKQIYDGIASKYEAAWSMPAGFILFKLVDKALSKHLAPIANPRVLELACGTGFFLRRIRSNYDCSAIAGVDISNDMISEAKRLELATRGNKHAINYVVGDCSNPNLDLGLEKASFDIVMANFLFNYAKSASEMLSMWQTVSAYLKPGGTFIALAQCFEPCPPSVAASGPAKYGVKVTVEDNSNGLVKQIMEFQTDPKVEFETYVILDQKVWETTAEEAGLHGLKFIYTNKEHMPEELEDEEFWEDLFTHPWNSLMVAHKS